VNEGLRWYDQRSPNQRTNSPRDTEIAAVLTAGGTLNRIERVSQLSGRLAALLTKMRISSRPLNVVRCIPQWLPSASGATTRS